MIVVARFAECMNIDLLMLPMHSEISETGLLNFVDLFFKNGPRPQCCYSWATGHRSRSTQGAEFDGIPKKCPKTRVLQIPQNGNFDGNDGNYVYIYIHVITISRTLGNLLNGHDMT